MTDTIPALLNAIRSGDYDACQQLSDFLEEMGHPYAAKRLRIRWRRRQKMLDSVVRIENYTPDNDTLAARLSFNMMTPSKLLFPDFHNTRSLRWQGSREELLKLVNDHQNHLLIAYVERLLGELTITV